MKENKKNQGLTLLEMLVVIVIVGILASFLVYSFSSSVQESQRLKILTFEENLAGKYASDLISQWNFDGGTVSGGFAGDGDVLDSWGYNNGEVGGHEPIVRTDDWCVREKCLEFDGDDTYVYVEDNGTLNPGGVTVSLWFKNNAAGESAESVLLGNGVDQSYRLIYDTSLDLLKWGVTLGSQSFYLESAAVVLEDEWHNVVVTCSETGAMEMYVDGVFSSSLNTAVSNLGSSVSGLGIGAFPDGSHNFNGWIDEVRVYKEALPLAEIQNQYLANIKK